MASIWPRNFSVLFLLFIHGKVSIGIKFQVKITKASIAPDGWCYNIPINSLVIHAGCKENLVDLVNKTDHPLRSAFKEFYCFCDKYMHSYEMCKLVPETLTNWCCGRLKCEKYFAGATVDYSRAITDPYQCLVSKKNSNNDKPNCYGIFGTTTTTTTQKSVIPTPTQAVTTKPPMRPAIYVNDEPLKPIKKPEKSIKRDTTAPVNEAVALFSSLLWLVIGLLVANFV